MQTFDAKRVENEDYPPTPGSKGQKHGIRAPGRIVMALREGSCWVQLQDGARENLGAKSVVIWEPGDWVEYGFNTGEGFKAQSYWEEDLSDEQWQAVFADAFGPDAVG
jgi:hypothetical protein